MDEKSQAYNELRKKEYELDEKKSECDTAKDTYRKALVNEAKTNILTVIKDEGKITEKDLDLFLGILSRDTKNLYTR